jgi:hypothetical protein
MLQNTLQTQPLRRKEDFLTGSLDRLSRALTADVPGHEREWAETVGAALITVENALRQHIAAVQDPDGVFAEVDGTRPTLARHASELCSQQSDLLKQVLAHQEVVQGAAEAFKPAADPTAPKSVVAVPAFGLIRQQAEQILEGLQHIKDDEAKLVLDSVNTDIGVGD